LLLAFFCLISGLVLIVQTKKKKKKTPQLQRIVEAATGNDAEARAMAESMAAERSAVAAREDVLRLVTGDTPAGQGGHARMSGDFWLFFFLFCFVFTYKSHPRAIGLILTTNPLLPIANCIYMYAAGPSPSTLFVCRLNPSTTSQDLGIIFNRFGRILSCEVRRDPKTNMSLGYGFVEFETIRSAEEAYMKVPDFVMKRNISLYMCVCVWNSMQFKSLQFFNIDRWTL
jgi:hypothetical protein